MSRKRVDLPFGDTPDGDLLTGLDSYDTEAAWQKAVQAADDATLATVLRITERAAGDTRLSADHSRAFERDAATLRTELERRAHGGSNDDGSADTGSDHR